MTVRRTKLDVELYALGSLRLYRSRGTHRWQRERPLAAETRRAAQTEFQPRKDLRQGSSLAAAGQAGAVLLQVQALIANFAVRQ